MKIINVVDNVAPGESSEIFDVYEISISADEYDVDIAPGITPSEDNLAGQPIGLLLALTYAS